MTGLCREEITQLIQTSAAHVQMCWKKRKKLIARLSQFSVHSRKSVFCKSEGVDCFTVLDKKSYSEICPSHVSAMEAFFFWSILQTNKSTFLTILNLEQCWSQTHEPHITLIRISLWNGWYVTPISRAGLQDILRKAVWFANCLTIRTKESMR